MGMILNDGAGLLAKSIKKKIQLSKVLVAWSGPWRGDLYLGSNCCLCSWVGFDYEIVTWGYVQDYFVLYLHDVFLYWDLWILIYLITFQYNDNNGNPYSDVYWLAALVQSIGELEFGQQVCAHNPSECLLGSFL